jgi:hypothetical protein
MQAVFDAIVQSGLKLFSGALKFEAFVKECAARRRKTVTSQLAEAAYQYATARDRMDRLEIRAPRTGYVHELAVHTLGGTIAPGQKLMSIIPSEEYAATSPEQRSRLLVSLVHLQDQLAALAYLRSLRYVDQNRLVVMGGSFGGIQTMLAVEGGHGYRVAVNCSGAAQTWRGSPDLRARLTAAASKATMPVFFLQAANLAKIAKIAKTRARSCLGRQGRGQQR